MKCPKCGSEMHTDEHRRYALQMCYNCGYIEGRMVDVKKHETNLAHLKNLNMNEAIVFISAGLDIDKKKVAEWLDEEFV